MFNKIKSFKLPLLALITLMMGFLTTWLWQVMEKRILMKSGALVYQQWHKAFLDELINVLTRPRIWLGIIWLAIFFLALILIFNNFDFAIVTYGILSVGIGIAIYYKNKLRFEPILPSDLKELKSFGSLLAMVPKWVPLATVLMFVVLGIIIAGLRFLRVKKQLRYLGLINRSLLQRNLVHGIVTVLLLGIIWLPFGINQKYIIDFYANITRYKPVTYDQDVNIEVIGPLQTFWVNRVSTMMDQPTGYSEATMKKLANKYTQIAAENNAHKTTTFKGQTVMYILSESLIDPKIVPELTTDKNPMVNIEQIMQNQASVSGTMISGNYGGGTANMEYMTLTGMPINNLASTVTTPYVQLTGNVKAMPNITNLFDEKAVLHPFVGTMYNRQESYREMGIDHFYTTDSKTAGPLKQLEKFPGGYTKDSAAYDDLLDLVAINSNKSQFLQLMTMQNHLGYDNKSYPAEYRVNITGKVPNADKSAMQTYLEGVNATDIATKDLIDKLDKLSRPVTMVFYGDHWPVAFSYMDPKKEDTGVLTHSTPYFIYQNPAAKKVNGTGELNKNHSYAAPSDFASEMLTVSNAKVSPYFALEQKVNKLIPANASYTRSENGQHQFIDAKGKLIDENNLTKKQKALLHDLRLAQYDAAEGENYLTKLDFYKVTK